MSNFWKKYSSIYNDLEIVKDIMRKRVKCNEKVMEEAMLDLINSGGKLLRPAFVLLSARFGDFDGEKLYPLASSVEMLHMGTLIHDDIVDEAKTRRGNLTSQEKYGKHRAVFIGDFLFCQCFTNLSNNTSMENMKLLSSAMTQICVGEIEQFSSRFSDEITVRKYLKRISSKTAALFSLSFSIGANESNCDGNLSKTLTRIGYDIGMAFQIIDDILDYTGDESLVGKPLGNDLKEGHYTLPLIYALKENDSNLINLLSNTNYTEDTINKIIHIVSDLGGLTKAKALAKRYTERCINRIYTLPDNEYKDILLNITKDLLLRDY